MKRIAWIVAAWLAASALAGGSARAQSGEAALRDRVGQLVERLGADREETREAAEKALTTLGPRALPFLPEQETVKDAERRRRLKRLRDALGAASERLNLGAANVTLKVKGMRLSEVMQTLQARTGNAISDLREAEGGEANNPALDLEIVDKPFLEALDLVCAQAEITPSFFTGDGTIGLLAGKPAGGAWVAYTGPFRVAFKQVAAVRDLQADTSAANAEFEVAWEPRLRPMLLKLDADALKIVDDRGQAIEAQVKQESTDVVLRPENPAAQINLNLKAPDRAARALASVRVKAEVTVPAGLKTFRFPTLSVKAPATIKQGDVAVTLEGTEVDEQVWKVSVVIAYPGEGPAFESYRQGLFNNRLWLQKADGSRFEHNGGFSNTASDEGKLGFEHLFVDVPGKPSDYGLGVETPSKVETIPLEFEFKDVPLP